MTDLEYLILFKPYGMPIYSRCFGHFCSSLMKDDVLLSAFLAALTSIGNLPDIADIGPLNFEGKEMNLTFNKAGELVSIKIGGTSLYFYYVKYNDYFIVAGFPADEFVMDYTHPAVKKFFKNVQEVLDGDYGATEWKSKEEFAKFEQQLLKKAVYPWMDENKASHSCMLGENCPLRIANIESKEKGIAGRIKETILSYRKMGMLSKMKMMMGGMIGKLRSSK